MASRTRVPRPAWAKLSNTDLLQLRIKDLGLRLEGTWLEDAMAELDDELAEKGIRFRPHVWLSDEWFSPSGVPGFAIPFYLAHPRLMRLERTQMHAVEGGTWADLLRIVRHETAHAIQHAYALQRRKRYQQTFGLSSTKYPEYYRPNPSSRRFVQHLPLWYAQSHPDEDFAETFAVWVKPRSDWRRRYADWPALRKLEYVDELMEEIGAERPLVKDRQKVEPAHAIKRTLAEHYAWKKEKYGPHFPNIYDRDLKRVFAETSPETRRAPTAASFLSRERAEIRRMVAKWTGEYAFTIDVVLTDMIGRCRELKLRAVGRERQLLLDFVVLLTAKTMHYLYSAKPRDWIAL
jgi:hypothetical protein